MCDVRSAAHRRLRTRHLHHWMSDVAPQVIVGPQLIERMVRVEEELKNPGETMEIRFQAVDRRFEAVDQRRSSRPAVRGAAAVMKADFDAVNKRLAAQQVRRRRNSGS